ncbi:MAG: zinc dependent phospholipase C family protein [Gemmatimonadota bacterium]|jgi:hypothetical protein
MPGITLHFHLARQGLEGLRASRVALPFDPDDPAALNAYMHGAIGPDLGYLPGGVRLLSDLAHCERTGELATNLVRTARTPVERAFAWGWVTHVLADRLIHPWVGRGVGELLLGCPATFVSGGEDPLSHLRVEIGVDLWFAARHADARRVRLRPAFDAMSVRFLQLGYALTYGVTHPREWFLESHISVGRRARQALGTLRLLGVLMEDAVWTFSLPRLRGLLAWAYRSSALRGISLAYLNPVPPSAWLLDGIQESIGDYRAALIDAVRNGAEGLGDFHLDTGAPLVPAPAPELAGAA